MNTLYTLHITITKIRIFPWFSLIFKRTFDAGLLSLCSRIVRIFPAMSEVDDMGPQKASKVNISVATTTFKKGTKIKSGPIWAVIRTRVLTDKQYTKVSGSDVKKSVRST